LFSAAREIVPLDYIHEWLLCKATLTNQALVNREGTIYYYLPLTPRVSTPTTAISSPFYMSMVDGRWWSEIYWAKKKVGFLFARSHFKWRC